MNFKKSERKVKDLVNNEKVIVLMNGVAFNTLVEWTLADFLEDEPPFVEVKFNDNLNNDTIYYTSNLEQSLLEFNGGAIVVVGV